MRQYDLEKRLTKLSVHLIDFSNEIPRTIAGASLAKQLVRAGISAALNYGEAQGAESRKDFIHKIRLVLKELREVSVCLNIIEGSHHYNTKEGLLLVKNESTELLAIFTASVKTATKT